MKKVIVYLNQFFGGIGGEEQAGQAPLLREGPLGPAAALQARLDEAVVTHTILCGDNYLQNNREAGLEQIGRFLEGLEFDLFLAGPAMLAGRYGMNCGEVCRYVAQRFGVPVVTSMHEENPGAEAFRRDVLILKGGRSAGKIREDAGRMASVANRILRGEELGDAETEGYFSRGIRRQVWRADGKNAADRAVEMLLDKLAGRPYHTEMKIEAAGRVDPAEPVAHMDRAQVALVTTGGLVPDDNPDRIPSAAATVWAEYPLADLGHKVFRSVHGGYDTANIDADYRALLPLDAAEALLQESRFGSLYPKYCATTGNLTASKDAERMAREITEHLRRQAVDAVILVST